MGYIRSTTSKSHGYTGFYRYFQFFIFTHLVNSSVLYPHPSLPPYCIAIHITIHIMSPGITLLPVSPSSHIISFLFPLLLSLLNLYPYPCISYPTPLPHPTPPALSYSPACLPIPPHPNCQHKSPPRVSCVWVKWSQQTSPSRCGQERPPKQSSWKGGWGVFLPLPSHSLSLHCFGSFNRLCPTS